MGAAIATRLVNAGYDLVLNDRREASLAPLVDKVGSAGGSALAVVADVASREGAAAVIDGALAGPGRIDALVTVAGGIKGPVKNPVWDITPEQWGRTVAVNLDSAFHCVQLALPSMMERRAGRIVTIGSTSWGGSADHAHYAAAKAGLVALTRSVATQVGPYGITANVIAPGGTVTMAAGLPGFPSAEEWADRNPLGRPNAPEDIAGAVAFLLSDDARNVSGHVLTVAGGLNPSL
jgi:NAD(P)-dependent dehydrogenase (short-subunit alcohol dehydrogenase family)